MKSKISNLLRNNVGKILGAFIFAFMCCGVMMPVHAFAASESITGKLTLELASSGGGGDVVPSGGDSSTIPIDASTSTSTGEFNFLPLILGILAVGLIVLLVYLYKTGKLKNKTLSVFALCLVVSVGFCGGKSIIANAADANDLKADNISTSAYLKFNNAGEILENNLEIINNTTDTITIENITSDSEYTSILPELKGTKVAGNSAFTAKLNCESIPDFAIEKVKENQGKIEVDGFFAVAYEKEQPVPEGEAYAYRDGTTLVITWDKDKTKHIDAENIIYNIPVSANQATDWEWDKARGEFTKVKISENFKNYGEITSTAYMFDSFKNVTDNEGFEYLDTSKVTNMSSMFYKYGESVSSLNTVPNVSKWDTSNVTDVSYMFSYFGFLSTTLNSVPDVSNWNISKVANMSHMFEDYGYRTTELNNVPNLSKWDTTKVEDVSYMFYNYGNRCVFENLDFSSFNTINISSYSYMLAHMNLRSITLGSNFNLNLTGAIIGSNKACLTNSSGSYNATWYDDNKTPYEKCGMGTTARTQAITYYDAP